MLCAKIYIWMRAGRLLACYVLSLEGRVIVIDGIAGRMVISVHWCN